MSRRMDAFWERQLDDKRAPPAALARASAHVRAQCVGEVAQRGGAHSRVGPRVGRRPSIGGGSLPRDHAEGRSVGNKSDVHALSSQGRWRGSPRYL